MKWFYFILAGIALIGVGFVMRKNQIDSAAYARSFRSKSESDDKENIDTPSV